jgi:O-glycosyl hydrolase
MRVSLSTALLSAALVACSSSTDMTPTAPTLRRAIASAATTPISVAALSATRSQEIKGWGVYPAGGVATFPSRPQIENAVYALGATLVRDQLHPNLYVSGNTLKNMVLDTVLLDAYIAKIQSAKAHGVTGYVLSVWSPPAAFKTNGAIWGNVNGNIGYLAVDSENAFVAFVTKVMMALKASSIGLPVALSIQNEPHAIEKYESCYYPPDQWQRVIKHVRGSFDYNGLKSITLIGPETGQYTPAVYDNYTTHTPGYLGGLGYPALTGSLDHAVGAYAFHTYAECSLWQTQQGIAAHPKDAWMTEYGNPAGTTELDRTLDMLAAMGSHLVITPFNYWFWWVAYAPGSGSPGMGALLSGTTTPIYSKRYWALQKIYTTVHPGWYVRSMTTTDPDLLVAAGTQNPCTARVDLMAFESPDAKTRVIMVVNVTANDKQVQVSGLSGTTQQSYRTDATNDMVAQTPAPVSNGVSTIAVPAHSAVLAVIN